jgi:glycosyltransferase involved in cell wall biosynthesis
MRICFLTSLNLATNPRVVKEIKLALLQGFDVQVVYQRLHNWSDPFSQHESQKLEQLGATIFEVDVSKRFSLAWIWIQCKYRLFTFLYTFFRSQKIGRKLAGSKSGLAMELAIRRCSIQPVDLVVTHNVGAFDAGLQLSKRFRCKLGVDVEDYHPGEQANRRFQYEIRQLLCWMIEQADYVSFASQPILEKCRDDFGQSFKSPSFVIINSFSESEFYSSSEIQGDQKLMKLVWFSQNISFGRGLEQFLEGIDKSELPIELTLIGQLNTSFHQQVLDQYDFVQIRPPLAQSELHSEIGLFDIGLAIEPGKDENNFLALSNKLLAYAQAGLFCIVTDTPGQDSFLGAFPDFGIRTSTETQSIVQSLQACYEKLEYIRRNKGSRYQAAKQFSWEAQAKELVLQWQLLIQSAA